MGWTKSPYPNPVNYELVITNYEWKQGDIVELFDMTGKRVYSTKPTLSIVNSPLSINMSSFQTGNYILRISSASGIVRGVAKVVKR